MSLEHTDDIVAKLRAGKRKAAIKQHNERVESELARARAGETICLTDLMAAKETLVVDAIERGARDGAHDFPGVLAHPDDERLVDEP